VGARLEPRRGSACGAANNFGSPCWIGRYRLNRDNVRERWDEISVRSVTARDFSPQLG